MFAVMLDEAVALLARLREALTPRIYTREGYGPVASPAATSGWTGLPNLVRQLAAGPGDGTASCFVAS